MEREYYKGNDCDEGCFIVSVPLKTLTYESLSESYNMLKDNIKLDEFTKLHMNDFAVWGFTENRVNQAPLVHSKASRMLLFASDKSFNNQLGLAICFDGKFYKLESSSDSKSESELYNIYKSKNSI